MTTLHFKWEVAAIAGLTILIAKTAPELTSVPRTVKLTHWGLVGFYSLMGVAGIRFAVMFCLKHERFVQAFSQPNVFGIEPAIMKWLALTFGILGSALYVAVSLLGSFRKRACSVFLYLVVPCSVLYPVTMFGASGFLGSFSLAASIGPCAVALFLVIASAAILFYKSQLVLKHFLFK